MLFYGLSYISQEIYTQWNKQHYCAESRYDLVIPIANEIRDYSNLNTQLHKSYTHFMTIFPNEHNIF